MQDIQIRRYYPITFTSKDMSNSCVAAILHNENDAKITSFDVRRHYLKRCDAPSYEVHFVEIHHRQELLCYHIIQNKLTGKATRRLISDGERLHLIDNYAFASETFQRSIFKAEYVGDSFVGRIRRAFKGNIPFWAFDVHGQYGNYAVVMWNSRDVIDVENGCRCPLPNTSALVHADIGSESNWYKPKE